MCSDNRTIGLERVTLVLLGGVQVTLVASITLITVALPGIQRDLKAAGTRVVTAADLPGPLPPAPALAVAGVLAGRLIPRFGARHVMVCGLVVAAAGMFLLARLGMPYAGLSSSRWGPGRRSPPRRSPPWTASRPRRRASPAGC